jgi:hypothetical protein
VSLNVQDALVTTDPDEFRTKNKFDTIQDEDQDEQTK